MSSKKVSPVMVEIIRNAFISIAEEMNASMLRSAYSPLIYESKDCSVGIFDKDARLLGQASGLPIFLGNLGTCIEILTEKVGIENYQAGDVYMMNDSYLQGTHLTDITVIAPIFYQEELVGFSASRADGGHIGGKDLGPSSDSTNIYQEGVRIPPVHLVTKGVVNEELLDILALNSFSHQARRGDISSQISACHKGNQRLCELYDKFGKETIQIATEEIFRQSERMDRAAISAIPDGVYTAEGYVDNDGRNSQVVPCKVKVTIEGEELTIDLTGSSGPTEGPLNCGKAQTISACRVAFKQLINPTQGVTGGNFRNLHVVIPDESIFNAKEPVPCQWYFTILGLLIDLVVKALADVLPLNAAGAHFGDSMVASFQKFDPRFGKLYHHTEVTVGGWDGFEGGDGESCVYNATNGDFKNVPVEELEHRFPLRVLSYQVRPDSEGAGKYRGGFGGIREIMVEDEGNTLCLWLDRAKMTAWGLFGGESAEAPVVVINPGTDREERFNKVSSYTLHKGDIVRIMTGGGGGFGNPLERDPEKVREDVENGYISKERAKKIYGKIS